MNVRATIIVKGRVNGVGYREIVDERAFPLELTGYVRELSDGCAEVVCEGEQEVIQAFIKRISLVRYPVRVTGVEVRYSDAAGEFPDFRIYRDGGPLSELGERLETAMRCVRDIQGELASQQDGRELLSRLLVVQHKALERLDRAVRLQQALVEGQLRLSKKAETGVRDIHASAGLLGRVLGKQEAAVAAVRSLDRHGEERSARLGRRLDRIASALSAIARTSGAAKRGGRRRRPRTKDAAGTDVPSPPAIEEGVAGPAADGPPVTEGGVAG